MTSLSIPDSMASFLDRIGRDSNPAGKFPASTEKDVGDGLEISEGIRSDISSVSGCSLSGGIGSLRGITPSA